jgi:Inosine-uridine nucleoside N-ribohydrolase
MKKVILDVDTGTDDAMAIAVALMNPSIEVIGITAVHGNLSVFDAAENTLRVVDYFKADVPVYVGCPEPMVQFLMPGRMMDVRKQTVCKVVDGKEIRIHERKLNLPDPSMTAQPEHACFYLVETLKNSEQKITVIAVGPLTNIGMALRMDPTIVRNIEEIVVMGGAVTCGNRTPVAEANFYDDPEAAQIVIKSGCRVRLFTLEATAQVSLGKDEADMFRNISQKGEFVAELIEQFIYRCRQLDICDDGCITMHDAVAVCGVIDPSVVLDARREACDVNLGGWCDGALVVDRRGFAKTKEPVDIVYDVDRERCLDIMLQAIKNAT